MSENVLELIGIVLLAVGAGLLLYGLEQIASWLALVVAGVIVGSAGVAVIVAANRGAE